jgi:hypothetical protein
VTSVLELEDTLLEPFPMDGLVVPVIRMTTDALPEVNLLVGDQAYRYDRSYPIKGYSAVLPRYLSEQVATGKKPLLIERPDRLYVYFAV